MEKYPSIKDYLMRAFYPSHQAWARTFTSKIFTAGIQTTSRVEITIMLSSVSYQQTVHYAISLILLMYGLNTKSNGIDFLSIALYQLVWGLQWLVKTFFPKLIK
jgi:hypothetical protein